MKLTPDEKAVRKELKKIVRKLGGDVWVFESERIGVVVTPVACTQDAAQAAIVWYDPSIEFKTKNAELKALEFWNSGISILVPYLGRDSYTIARDISRLYSNGEYTPK
jgi:hypothetical protein